LQNTLSPGNSGLIHQNRATSGTAPDVGITIYGNNIVKDIFWITDHRHLFRRISNLTVLDSKTCCTARMISGYVIDAKADEFGHQKPVLTLLIVSSNPTGQNESYRLYTPRALPVVSALSRHARVFKSKMRRMRMTAFCCSGGVAGL
jgi:hypothetical protein